MKVDGSSRMRVFRWLSGRGAAVMLAGLILSTGSAPAVDAIRFETPGAGDGLRNTLVNASLLIAARRDGVSDPQELIAAANAEYGRLVAALYGAGHYSGVVRVMIDGREAATLPVLGPPPAISEIVVRVDPGPPFTFSRAEIGPLAEGTELPEGFAAGQRARSNTIRAAANAATQGWRAVGHAKAEPGDPAIVADHRAQTLDARVPILPGPRVQFGDFNITGTERMRPERVAEIAGFPTGEVFDPEAIETSARRLRRTGSFASVALSEADDLGPGATLDVTAALIEAPRRRIGFGAEFDTEDGVRLSAFWLHRNLLGGAERLRLEGEVGGIGAQAGGQDYRFSARFTRPATFTPETSLSLGAFAETVDDRDFDAVRSGADIGLTHFFSDTVTARGGVSYLYERADDGVTTTTRTIAALPLGLTWDRRDNERNTTSGFYLDAAATPFYGITGTDSGAQLTFDGRVYRGFGEEARVVLAGRVQVGSVLGAAIDRTPRDLLFYSGGGGSVRGQPFQSLGVTVGGIDSGGRGFAALSGEVRGAVTDTIGLVGFVDAGQVSADSLFSSGDWHAGAGLGLRYQTGIGPIRVDVAAPVRGNTGNGAQLYIGIGQAF